MSLRLWSLAIVILLISFVIPRFMPHEPADYLVEKKVAVEKAREMRTLIGPELLGLEDSDTTTTLGYKDAKILSAAPDFPALLVQWLKEAGVQPGDRVAINASGSFPALTIASLAAVDAVGAKPLLISSLGASSWGANRPDNTWLHMEKKLLDKWPQYQSIAVSLGGDSDRAIGLPEEGQRAFQEALKLTSAPLIQPSSASDVVEQRIRIWKKNSQEELPKVLINVGGNLAFWGTMDRDSSRAEGLIWPKNKTTQPRDGIGDEFLKANRPIIHLLGIKKLAAQYEITNPSSPQSPLWVSSRLSLFGRITLAGVITIFLLLVYSQRKKSI